MFTVGKFIIIARGLFYWATGRNCRLLSVSIKLWFTLHAHALIFVDSMTWLKKKIQELGLYRRGIHVSYTPIPLVKKAIKVVNLRINSL